MGAFQSDTVEIAFDDVGAGEGRPILLVHGFASNRKENWLRLGWYGAFERKRVRCVALDCRGHGESGRPHDPLAYSRATMAGDVLALASHLSIPRFHLMGYSMGARIALATCLAAPERVATLTLGGVGRRLMEPEARTGNPMAAAMEAASPDEIGDPLLKSFRAFADEQGEDRLALAALTRAPEVPFDWDALKALKVPVLVVAGARDELAGDPEPLAGAFGDGRAVTLPGCDHFSAIAHALYKATVFGFLDGTLP